MYNRRLKGNTFCCILSPIAGTEILIMHDLYCIVHNQSHSQNDSGDLRGAARGDGELGCTSHLCDGSAHSSGCVVNGSKAMAAF